MQSFRICDIVPPLSFKTPLCCVYSDKKNLQSLINVSLSTCPTPLPAIFRARRHRLVICQRRGASEEHLCPSIAQGQTPLPAPPSRGEGLSQFVQFIVTLHHTALIISHTHQFSDMSESKSISILQITISSFYHLCAGTPPKLYGIVPELPVLCLMNLVCAAW